MLGAGRATELHMNAYQNVHGIDIRFKVIYDSIKEKADVVKEKYGFEISASSLDEVFNDPEIDVIDICTPPYTHKDFVIKGLKSDKHVICEKPLCGFFGSGDTDKRVMIKSVLKDLDEIEQVVRKSKKQLFYAENWIYAPAIQKAAEIIKAKHSKILYAKGEESLAGSSSPVAGLWEKNGGGTLMRVGCHPLAAIIYLKKINNPSVSVTKVVADIDRITDKLTDYEHRHIRINPINVEDHATVCLTFSDNTKAVIIACDSRLGGSKNCLELYCNDIMIECNLTMNNAMSTYLVDEDGMEKVEISEMIQTKCGWNTPFISDETIRGYLAEIQNFMDCIAFNKRAKSDAEIGLLVVRIIYESYLFGSLKEN